MNYRTLLSLLLLCLALGACSYTDAPPDFYEGVPADLAVRQVPANPVRAGTLVQFTATYGDSLNPNARVSWGFQDGARPRGRTVEWRAPMKDTTYQNDVMVTFEGFPSASRGFAVVVIP